MCEIEVRDTRKKLEDPKSCKVSDQKNLNTLNENLNTINENLNTINQRKSQHAQRKSQHTQRKQVN